MRRNKSFRFKPFDKRVWRIPGRSKSMVSAALVWTLVLGLPAATSSAAEGGSVTISGLSISELSESNGILNTSHLVVLSGTYTNQSDKTIEKLELNLVTTPALNSRSELEDLIEDPTSSNELISSKISALLTNLAPGSTKSWKITFRGESVLGTKASGVYGVGVRPNLPNSSPGTVITTPWFYDADIQPTNVSLVIPLTTLNAHLANGDVPDRKSDVAEAKRLTDLILNQDGYKVSWLQDPALQTWIDQLKNETDSEAPMNLESALLQIADNSAVLPYGHADLTALVRANQQDALTDTLNLTRATSGGRQIYYAPVTGIADRQTVSLLNQENVASIVSNEFLRGNASETTDALATSSSNSVLVHDLAASECLNPVQQTDASFFESITCIKSEIGMMTAESPQKSRSVIVLTPTNFDVSNERLSALVSVLSDQNWVQLTTLDYAAAGAPTQNYIASPSVEPREFSRTLVRQSQSLKINTESLSALYDDQELSKGFNASRVLGFSDLWSSNAKATEYLTENLSLVNEYLGAVSVQASSRITTPAENSEIPITIVNESDRAVSVSVDLTSSATSRFSAEPSGIIQVDGGQRVTVPISITLVGAGVVDVQAQLIAPNGERFGAVENIQISSAAYSQFARTLVWGAFGLLVLLALSNFVKRRRDKRSLETSEH